MPSLYTIKAIAEQPKSGSSADAICIVTGEDHQHYIIKGPTKNNPYMAASEWLCIQLASSIGIPSPSLNKIEYEGNIVAGIMIEGGTHSDYNQSDQHLIMTDFKGDAPLSLVSSAAVFDAFIFNPDRHFNNFLRRKTIAGGAMTAIDYSRAFLSVKWPLPEPIDIKETESWNTFKLVSGLNGGLDKEIIASTINRLRKVDTQIFSGWLNEMPCTWISDTLRSEIVMWFDNGRTTRLDKVEEVIDEI